METKQSIINHLIGKLKEELDGIIKYNDLYEKAKEAHDYDVARMINDIAIEERSHVMALREYLEDSGEYRESEHPDIIGMLKNVRNIFEEDE